MRDGQAYAKRERSILLPALWAHDDRLSAGYDASLPRAVRLASAKLLTEIGGAVAPAGTDDDLWIDRLSRKTASWRLFHLAGACRFGRHLRARVGTPLMRELLDIVGGGGVREALRHDGDPLAADDSMALDALHDAGASLVLSHIARRAPHAARRIVLGHSEAATARWSRQAMDASVAVDDAHIERLWSIVSEHAG